jgi:hypothetical protein
MAFKADLTVTKGLAPRMQFTWNADGVPVNLTGCTAKLQAKVGGAGAALFTLTTRRGGITLGGALGTIAWRSPRRRPASLPWTRRGMTWSSPTRTGRRKS